MLYNKLLFIAVSVILTINLVQGYIIDHVPFSIDKPGYYILNKNFTNISSNYAIKIISSNVILDGSGFIIEGDKSGSPTQPKIGVIAKGVENVTIVNLTANYWYKGIVIENVKNSLHFL